MLKKAFTLIELLIVIVIIGVLATAITVSYSINIKKSRCTRVVQDFDAISKAAVTFRETNNRWANEVGLNTGPEFVPDYLKTWPTANYYKTNHVFDYQRLPTDPAVDPEVISIRLVLFAASGINASNALEYYCIQDLRANHSDCEDANDDNIPVGEISATQARNRGGDCAL